MEEVRGSNPLFSTKQIRAASNDAALICLSRSYSVWLTITAHPEVVTHDSMTHLSHLQTGGRIVVA